METTMPIRLAQARLSEGRAIHQVTTKKKGGKFETANKTVEGASEFYCDPHLGKYRETNRIANYISLSGRFF